MRRGKTLVLVLSSLALGAVAHAVSDSSPYRSIPERNVFNLKPPVAPPDPTQLAIQQAPKLTLTGITTILGNKRALITVPSAKPGQPPEPLMLAEGQSQNDVEVMEINEVAGTVKVNNHGAVQTLDFLNNGAKPTPGAPPSPMSVPPPPAAPMPGNLMPPPPGNSSVTPLKSLPQRTLRLPGSQNSGQGAAMGTAAGAGGVNNQSDQQQLSAEEQAALIYLNTQKMKAEGNPMSKIMPPIKGMEDPPTPR